MERVLLDSPFYKTAKAYIIYREQHNQIRNSSATRANVDLVENPICPADGLEGQRKTGTRAFPSRA
ncbi:MAG: hypothetical protein U5K27_01855 [Desulfotignum sp.]|nr:hypothetical protein [Desulfotignum sp.]